MADRYGSDVLTGTPSAHHRSRPTSRPVPATTGRVVEEVQSGFVGAVVRVEKSGGVHLVVLEGRGGALRSFPLGPGFWIDGQPVTLTPPLKASAPAATHSASGSRLAAAPAPARTARASRIWVEGRHDAELIEKVWGDDLREVGVVVEMLDGVDNLAERLAEFAPSQGRRVGVLVDHLVPGSKERRVADAVLASVPAGSVEILGHPYVDVWEAVKPARLGLAAWPVIPRGTDVKVGTLRALGWPAATQADVAAGWRRILGAVTSYRDLEPALLSRVEALIDFVTA
ncbi:MAG: DUF3097 domain-containing protein [Promicromonosporaceae bacterium]|nr:DUF3097 domain-containing protein [Promicromonosporaceae bacterium]